MSAGFLAAYFLPIRALLEKKITIDDPIITTSA